MDSTQGAGESAEAAPAAPAAAEAQPAAAKVVTFGGETSHPSGGESGVEEGVEATPPPEGSEAGEEPEKEGMLEFIRHVTQEWPREMSEELKKIPGNMRTIATKLQLAALNPCATCAPPASGTVAQPPASSPEKADAEESK